MQNRGLGTRPARRAQTMPSTAGLALATLLLAGGCMTMEGRAPPVTAAMAGAGKALGFRQESLEAGRRLYLSRCSTCHNIEPVGKYTPGEWERTLVRMSKDARLSDEQAADLRGYILSAAARE